MEVRNGDPESSFRCIYGGGCICHASGIVVHEGQRTLENFNEIAVGVGGHEREAQVIMARLQLNRELQ
jgi:hypothetical protein